MTSRIVACAIFAAIASSLLSTDHVIAAEQSRYSTVISPVIPQKIRFCGDDINLDRVDMSERLDRELTSIIYTHGNTLLTLKRANRYFPVMAPILKANRVPLDFLYLACVESYLNPKAYSGAKAAGIWQFIPSTATEYGLEVNDEVDERYNLEKATDAACRYLKKAYAKFGNWETVMAGYNGGMARMTRELEAQGVNSAFDLYLADETMRYIFRIIAMKEVMERPADFGFRLNDSQLYQPRDYKVVEVSGPVADWPAWAAARGITYAQLRDDNPWIRSKKLTNKSGKTYRVLIPTQKSLHRSTLSPKKFSRNDL